MAKAKVKKENELPKDVKIIDLSPEKRGELYEKALQEFDKSCVETYGYTLDVELVFNKKGVVPRLVKLDVLTLKNEQDKRQNEAKTKSVKN